ncbi:hypothetical protein C0J52_16808 [Blattella germanica]|nr:hypothetical protein C0J52_16808 [Blattella germanica]
MLTFCKMSSDKNMGESERQDNDEETPAKKRKMNDDTSVEEVNSSHHEEIIDETEEKQASFSGDMEALAEPLSTETEEKLVSFLGDAETEEKLVSFLGDGEVPAEPLSTETEEKLVSFLGDVETPAEPMSTETEEKLVSFLGDVEVPAEPLSTETEEKLVSFLGEVEAPAEPLSTETEEKQASISGNVEAPAEPLSTKTEAKLVSFLGDVEAPAEPLSTETSNNNKEKRFLSSVLVDHLKMQLESRKCVQKVELAKGTATYRRVEQLFLETLEGATILSIVQVQNPFIFGCYCLKKAEYASRLGSKKKAMVLFHATARSNVDSIIMDNLDWRRVNRSKFGTGVSFANSSHYANMECRANRGHFAHRTSERAMIVAKVLVGKTELGHHSQELPSKGYDTTRGRSSVYVKYYDNEFYPKYVVYYRV